MALSFWLVLAAVWVLFLVPVLRLRRRVDRHAWPAWAVTLHGELASHYSYLAEVFEGNAELVRDLAVLAEAHAQRGSGLVARRRLASLFGFVEGCSQAVIERLDEWLVVCRAAVTLYPVGPLPAVGFRLRALRAIAFAHRGAHTLAVTSGERFRLRLHALEWAFRWLRGTARRAGARVGRRAPDVVKAVDWRAARALAHDFEALSGEALVTAQGLLRAAETGRRR